MEVKMHARTAGLLVLLLAAALAVAGSLARASDHQDAPEVEINSACDVNDVYAFPGSATGRIVLVMTTHSPLPAGSTAGFDTDKLYQIKIDNDTPSDGVEDLVLQFTFDPTGGSQEVTIRGPVAPTSTGTRNRLINVDPTLKGAVNTSLGSATGVQAYAGLLDDPFFLDLEQFFRILPDRRPVGGALSVANPINPPAWRNPAPNYLQGYNALALVVELPASMLTAGGTSRLGIWGTISR
jgi:hypothetical protein